MTTFKHPRGKTWNYDFRYTFPGETKSRRYTGSTGQLTKEDADLFEAKVKQRVRQEWAGIAPMDRSRSPSLHAFAERHLLYLRDRGRPKRLDFVKATLRLCLQFFGRRPATLPDPKDAPAQWRQMVEAAAARAQSAPYHDLKLIDPVLEPKWIVEFEDWMTSLGLSGSRKNHYRSAMSGIYRTAMLPRFRQVTGVTMNPFLNMERDQVRSRDAVLSPEQLRAWMQHAAPHVRVAMALAVYAPELRRGAILGLKWGEHVDAALTKITTGHKTQHLTGRPQVIPISDDLAAILRWVRQQQPGAKHVVAVRDRRGKWAGVKRIETALRNAVARVNADDTLPPEAKFVYGFKTGVTFHSIRHTLATWLAEWGIAPEVRQLLMGHLSYSTTERYTHMAASAKRAPLGRIAGEVALVELVQGPVQSPTSRKGRNASKSMQRTKAVSRKNVRANR